VSNKHKVKPVAPVREVPALALAIQIFQIIRQHLSFFRLFTINEKAHNHVTMESRLCLLFLLAVHSIVYTEGWGALFEPIKGGYGFSTILRAARVGDDENEDFFSYRASLERTYRYQSTIIDNLPKWDNWIQGAIQSSRELLWEPIVGNDSADVLDEVLEDDSLICGEDCMECAIPDEFKAAAQKSTIDVMAFLGIHRAAPLQVSRPDGEWD
jgi:hypothetical protein